MLYNGTKEVSIEGTVILVPSLEEFFLDKWGSDEI